MITGKLVGARVNRVEDPRLVTGQGNYVAGMKLPDMVEMTIIRSQEAHAKIGAIDSSAALALAGVHAVITGAQVAEFAKPLRAELDPELNPTFKACDWYPLAVDRVRYCGEGIAVVVADNRYIAEDAAELVEIELEPLPAVVDPIAAQSQDSALVHEEWSDNILSEVAMELGDTDSAFSGAHKLIKQRFHTGRHWAVPLEGRACLADFDKVRNQLTLNSSTQMPHLVRTELSALLDMPENNIRVVAPDVGGGFGLKASLMPEEVLTATIAKIVGRPIRWIEDRFESFTASFHAKEEYIEAELAVDADGRLLAARYRGMADVGAYNAYPWTSSFEPIHAAQMFPGPYQLQHYDFNAKSIATNKTTMSTYRGVGAPISNLVMEGLLDAAAVELQLDPIDIRRRNLITNEQFPYTSVTGLVYEEGSYLECLERAAEMIGYEDFRAQQQKLRDQGIYQGIGISCYNEITAAGSAYWGSIGAPIAGYESANVKFDPSGHVTLYVGTHSHGQAHETIYAQIAADELGMPMDRISVRLGDTAESPYGRGTWASRAAVAGGGAVIGASQKVAQKIKLIAAHLLDVDAENIELVDGYARVPETTGLSIAEIARQTIYSHAGNLPEGMEPGLEATHFYEPPLVTIPNATHIATVEVDIDTGRTKIMRYVVVEDCGTLINPMVVDGQITGGVAQGIGGALLEEIVYDENGQPLTTTFMDYLMPSTTEVPRIEIGHIETPSPHTAGGFKGCGEGGAIAAFGVIANAVSDALAPFGIRMTDLPITPSAIRAKINAAS